MSPSWLGPRGTHASINLSLSDDDGDIETLVDFEDTFTTAPIKGVLESVIVILTLVRVSLFFSSHRDLALSGGRFFRRLMGGGKNVCGV